MEVILLERVAKLGHMGETVRVKDGFARNFLLPRGKALARDRGQQEEVRGPARTSSRRAISNSRTRPRRNRPKLDGQSLHHHPPGRRNRPALRFGVRARHRRDDQPPPRASRSIATRSRCRIRSRRSACTRPPVHLHPEVEAHVTINVARSPEQAERQSKGEDLSVREETSMDDLGLEVGQALAEAGPGESLGRE